MRRSSWKRVERVVAAKVGGRRNPLSGSSSGHTSGDVISDNLYVEVKTRKSMAIFKWWDNVKKKAIKEGKRPLLVLHQTGKHSYLKVEEL